MSFDPDSPGHEVSVEDRLENIELLLRLIAERLEEAFETGITEEDIE